MKRKFGWSLLTLVVFTGAILEYTQSASSNPSASPSRPNMAPPNVFNVNSTMDILSPGAGTVTLRSAIVAANADLSGNPSVINLTVAGTYTLTLANANEENAAMSGDLDITTTNHSVTIAGMGSSGPNATIIDASGLNTGAMHDRAFHITGPGVTAVFQDLVIENGQATNDGTNGASTDPTTVNNGHRAGGGILNNGGSVTLTNVIIKSCNALGRGDVAGSPPGSILEAHGGALASLGMTGSVAITDSTLMGNAAQGGDGTPNANVNIASGADGGAIYFEAGMLNITGSQINTCSANGGNGQDSPPIDGGMTNGGQGGLAQGGGLWVGSAGTVMINKTTFESTAANGGKGGGGGNGGFPGGEADGGAMFSSGTVTVTNSTFHLAAATGGSCNSSAGTGGFGAHNAGDGGMARGGAIHVESGTVTVDTDTFANNSAVGGNGGNGGQTDRAGGFDFGSHGQGGKAFGGAIDNNASAVHVKHCTISLNTAQGGNSGVNTPGSPGTDKPPRLVAAGTGGGIRVGSPPGFDLENTIIGGNTAANGTGDTTGAPTPGPDVDGAVTSNGHNLLTSTTNATGFTGTGDITGVNPMLAALANNGGPTLTMALMPGSPAIDAGVAAGAMFDQRGKPRTFDNPAVVNAPTSDGTDIGAFEAQPNCALTCPSNISVPNDHNQCGAVVTFSNPGETGPDCTGMITCMPASGSLFPVGTTTVNCSDSIGANCSFKVTVNDTQNPTITCPANITKNAPGASSTTVTFAPMATDNCPGVTSSCIPASGSTFGLGTTPVTCTAKDASGNMATCMFTVTVTNFDTCLKDNSTGNLLQWNSTSGAYKFTRCSDGFMVTGTGMAKVVNGVRTILDSRPDRIVTGNFNTGQLTGNATINLLVAPGSWQGFRIVDTNPFATCSCGP